MTWILSSSGLEVTEAESGEEALKQVSQHNYDLVLMDIQMPGLDGYGTFSELRKRGFQRPRLRSCYGLRRSRHKTN